ncbi:hypothetical protein RCH07_003923, partial [Arthrobacter sp. CG_A4]|nr:hypothetical protein [Arthrobacter sp. CG_A4]
WASDKTEKKRLWPSAYQEPYEAPDDDREDSNHNDPQGSMPSK